MSDLPRAETHRVIASEAPQFIQSPDVCVRSRPVTDSDWDRCVRFRPWRDVYARLFIERPSQRSNAARPLRPKVRGYEPQTLSSLSLFSLERRCAVARENAGLGRGLSVWSIIFSDHVVLLQLFLGSVLWRVLWRGVAVPSTIACSSGWPRTRQPNLLCRRKLSVYFKPRILYKHGDSQTLRRCQCLERLRSGHGCYRSRRVGGHELELET